MKLPGTRGARIGMRRVASLGLALALCACSARTPSPSPTTVPSRPPSASPSTAQPEELPAAVKPGPYRPQIDRAAFVDEVTNAYFPLPPGARWVYRGSGDARGELDIVTVLHRRVTVMGVSCTVVHDEVREGGKAVEVTDDWYAQDVDGNVWYFGEETAEFHNGTKSTAGSWQAGVRGAKPGILMPGTPLPGIRYHQEFWAGKAEDLGEVIRTGATVSVTAGEYGDVLVTEDTTPLEPRIREHKYYAAGVGLVKEQTTAGGNERFELIRVIGL